MNPPLHPAGMPGERQVTERVRVAMVINDLGAGGAQRAMLEQARALDPGRFEVEVASLEIKPTAPWAQRNAGTVPLRRTGATGWLAYLKNFRPHIVHAHLAAGSLAAVIGARAGGRSRVVATCHNLTDWEEKRGHPLRIASRALLTGCDALVAVSEAVRDAVQRVRPDLADRITVIYNGADLAPFAPAQLDRARARHRLGYETRDFVVGSVARLDPRKGLDVLLEAAARVVAELPHLRVLIVGEGPERDRLERQAAGFGLAGRVKLVGEMADVRPCLAAMDLFAAPSRTEGMGMALVEAMAAGIPVAGARVGGIPEVLEQGGAGWLIEGHDPRTWAEALVRATRLPQERQRLSKAGIRRARAFSIDQARDLLEALYDRLADDGTSREASRVA